MGKQYVIHDVAERTSHCPISRPHEISSQSDGKKADDADPDFLRELDAQSSEYHIHGYHQCEKYQFPSRETTFILFLQHKKTSLREVIVIMTRRRQRPRQRDAPLAPHQLETGFVS